MSASFPSLLFTCVSLIPNTEYQDLVVQFRPLSGKRFVETATVSASHRGAALECQCVFQYLCKGLVIDVLLRVGVLSGEGVSPSLTLSPADGLLDLGNVMAGDTSTATAKLTNTSAFPLSFTIRSVGRPYSNHNGSAVVVCSPQQGRLEPGAETALRITFAPDHVSRKEFLTRFDVIVPNQTSDMQLVVKGRSWARQVWLHAACGIVLPLGLFPSLLRLHLVYMLYCRRTRCRRQSWMRQRTTRHLLSPPRCSQSTSPMTRAHVGPLNFLFTVIVVVGVRACNPCT